MILQALAGAKFHKTVRSRTKTPGPGPRAPTLASCLAQKRRLQVSLLSLAAKLSIARSNLGKSGNVKKAKVARKKSRGSRSASLKQRNTAAIRAAKEKKIKAKKQARVGREDDWFASLIRRHGGEHIPEAQIQAVLRQADDDANRVVAAPAARRKSKTPLRKSKSPSRPIQPVKRRIAPTFLRPL